MPTRFTSPPEIVVLQDGGGRLLIGPPHLMSGIADTFRVRDHTQLEMLIIRYADRPDDMAALRRLVVTTDVAPRQRQPDRDMLKSLAGQSLGWPLAAAHLPVMAAINDGPVATGAAVDLDRHYRQHPVSSWTLAQRLDYVVETAVPLVDDKIAEELRAMVTPEALGSLALFIGTMAVATATGLGAAFAVIATAAAFAALGWSAWTFLKEVGRFLDNLVNATSPDQLHQAGDALAKAAAVGGVALIRVLLRRGYQTVRAKPARQKAVAAAKGLSATKPKVTAPLPSTVKVRPTTPGIREPGAVAPTPALIRQVADRSRRIHGRDLDHADKLGTWPKLAAQDAKNFASDPIPDRLPAGTKIYRVIHTENGRKGHYWSLEPPTTHAAFRSGYAVKNDWSSASGYVTATVPEGGLPVWRGPTAAQVSSDKRGFLPGGKEQIWLDPTHLDIPDALPTPWNR
ncbi:MAG: hypothetical protein ACOVN0_19980 [Niveispirillum sp.]|uniref:hypothetical protein n=1 Tax=Niveispirillum sp. TaxID=1917217 RepID=UPI003BA678FE